MSLEAGSRLGSFEVVRPLGAGGMGEVYLAHDRELNRSIAVKVLPPEVTSDPQRVARFEQEARAASALNHPNVCVIHALGRTEDGRRFIAMEHVDGQTLRRRLAGRRLTRREGLDIGVQIASALSAAHAAGVVHRDVKPENVMLRPDGFVKVLDFGLAKLVQPSSDPALATRTVVHTDAGAAVGTVSYMSPEQARAQDVDARTDVWALGAVLYEMSAGQPPFVGASVSDVIAGILEREPDPLARFDRDVPQELQRIVGKALRKNPDQRYQVMKDLLLDLEALRDELAVSSAARPRATGRPPAEDRRGRWLQAAGAAVLAAAVTAGIWWVNRPAAPAQPATARAPVDRPLTRLTFDPGLQTDPAFSPDGRSIAYASDDAGNFDIWVQSVTGGDARQVTRSPAQETQPAWAPDGRSIVYRSERDGGGLFIVPAGGGPERHVSPFGTHPVWSPDGLEVLFRTGFGETHTNVYAVSPDGSEAPRELLAEFLAGGVWTWIAPHPDGRISVVGIHPKRRFGFFTVSRDGREVTASELAADFPLQWAQEGTRLLRFQWDPTGTALYLEAVLNEVRNVWKVRVEPAGLAWLAAERLTTGMGPDVAASISSDGKRLAFTAQRQSTRLWAFPFDAAKGRIADTGTPFTPEEGGVDGLALSPDGRYAAYTLRRSGSNRFDVWLTDIDSGATEVFASNAGAGAWSPDSTTLAYSLSRPNVPPPGEWAMAVREVGGPERIVRGWSTESVLLPSGWTSDGRAIVGSYVAPLFTGVAQIALWPLAAPAETRSHRILVSNPESVLWQATLSPDDRWLSFVVQPVSERARAEVAIARAGGAPSSAWIRVAASHAWADKPRWAPDGKALFFISREASAFFNLWGVRFDPERGALVGDPFMITRFDSPGLVISPDVGFNEIGISAQRAVLTMTSVTGNIWMLENVDR